MELRDRRDLYNGFGDGLAHAFEIALTPAIFGGVGYFLDRALGTSPLFLLALVFFAVCGVGYMSWHRYDAEMKVHEADGVWNRSTTARREVA